MTNNNKANSNTTNNSTTNNNITNNNTVNNNINSDNGNNGKDENQIQRILPYAGADYNIFVILIIIFLASAMISYCKLRKNKDIK